MVDGGFAFPLVNTLGFREGRYLCRIDYCCLCYLVIAHLSSFFLRFIISRSLWLFLVCRGRRFLGGGGSSIGYNLWQSRYTRRGKGKKNSWAKDLGEHVLMRSGKWYGCG
jgi:hypothetical protein